MKQKLRDNKIELILVLILVSVLFAAIYVGLALKSAPANSVTVDANSCALQESKPVLIILLNGPGSPAICQKIVAKSNNRYFTYYGEPSLQYSVMCAVLFKHVQWSVYDIVPSGITPTTRYSMTTMCPLLVQHHRLIGEGF